MINRWSTLAILISVSLIGVSGCGSGNSDNSDTLSQLPTGNSTDGTAKYQTNCQRCHAVSNALSSFDSTTIQSAVRRGRGGMPAFSTSTLSDQDLADIIAYILN